MDAFMFDYSHQQACQNMMSDIFPFSEIYFLFKTLSFIASVRDLSSEHVRMITDLKQKCLYISHIKESFTFIVDAT